MSNESFLETAASAAQQSADPEERANYDSLIGAGQQATAAFTGQSRDALRQIANDARSSAASQLGGGSTFGASESEQRGLIDLIGGSGENGEMRRKILAAALMAKSEDRDTARRGETALAEIRATAAREDKLDAYDQALSAVYTQINGMDEDARRNLVRSYSGMTTEQANERVDTAGRSAQRAQGADMQGSAVERLGSRAADTYARSGVEGLRRDANSVEDTRIREMLTDGHSTTAEIERAINTAIGAGVDGGSGATAEGAGMSAEERANLSGTDAMIAAITEGMGDLPGAAQRLDSAAARLERAAASLGGTSMDDGLAAGSGDSSGFSVENGRATLRLGGYNILTI
jgi:hypothetical protein